MKNTLRCFFVVSIVALATACATFEEPLVNPELDQADTGEDAVRQKSGRLLIPETPTDTNQPETALEPATPDTTGIATDTQRLPIPGVGLQGASPTAANAPGGDPNPPSLPGTEPVAPSLVAGNFPQPGVNEPSATGGSSTLPAPGKPHYRNDNIAVVTWRAERGHIPSQLLLGRAYARGDGVVKDMEQARLWLELASMQNDKSAQYELGLLYFIGAGVDQNYLNAREWWLEAAINGNDKAQQKLGYMYSEGIGVERDYQQAKSWYMKSASLGNAEAQTLLGSLFHEGNRIPPDYQQAHKYYQLAAEQGHPHAQYALGILHHDGLGTEQDYVKCAAWVDVALANEYSDELGARELCRSQLDEQANAAADALAELWKSQYLLN